MRGNDEMYEYDIEAFATSSTGQRRQTDICATSKQLSEDDVVKSDTTAFA